MLTTKPFTGGAGPMMGGAGAGGAMPEARQMSGQPRQDREEPPGSYTVRLTYNNLAMVDGKPKDGKPPVGETVTLVGYAADDSVSVVTGKVDEEGHATFPNLDPSGSTVYFALATLPRGPGVDRVMAMPIQLDGQVGVRSILSGDKRDATTPNIDELASQQAIATPAGQVRVTLEGVPADAGPIRLVNATGAVVAQMPAAPMPPDPKDVQSGVKYAARGDLAAGTLEVQIHGGPDQVNDAIANIEIHVIPADATDVAGGVKATTAADGWVSIPGVPTAGLQKAVYTINGRSLVSEPFDVSKSGGALDVGVRWASSGRPQALFDVPFNKDLVLYAETTVSTGKLAGNYRSLPFQVIPQTGTHVGVVIYPRIMMKFSLRASIEDQLLAVQGRWTIDNNSWSPYRGGPDGMMIPLPHGFKGGVVADMNQADVAVVPTEGLRVIRPIPPGQKSFIAGFSLAVDDGDVAWSLDLPMGTFGSDIQIKQSPGMDVQLGAGKGDVREGKDGNKYFVVENIRIHEKQSMALTITGLPAPAAWKVWVPRFVGVLVIATILAGVALTIFRKREPIVATAASRRAALLDELVDLERSGKDPARREQVMSELEKLWVA